MADKVHTGMRIDSEQLSKLKYVAWNDRRTFTSVMELAIDSYIAMWEKENGAITAKLLEKAKII